MTPSPRSPIQDPATPPLTTTEALEVSSSAAGLTLPIAGANVEALRHSFEEMRGSRKHEAVDFLAPRGTPVLAVDDGVVAKLFVSARGGITIYQFNQAGTHCYYYAHLDRYAPGLYEGQQIRRGETIGTVGTTGNAPIGTPHLHFAVNVLGPEKQWWKGTPIDPVPLLEGHR